MGVALPEWLRVVLPWSKEVVSMHFGFFVASPPSRGRKIPRLVGRRGRPTAGGVGAATGRRARGVLGPAPAGETPGTPAGVRTGARGRRMKITNLLFALVTAMTTHVTGRVSTNHDSSQPQLECRWGNGAAVPQPGSAQPVNLTCTPPSVIGSGSTTVNFDATLDGDSVYLDAQVFSYHPKPPATGNRTP